MGGPHPPAKGGPRQEAAPALWDSSRAALLTRSSSWRIINLRKFPVQSENISRSKFVKQKDSKNRELALGILSIGQSDKMLKNDINDSKNMWQYYKTSMDHSKIIDTFETYQHPQT